MGGLLLALGIGTFLVGALVLTNNARHGRIDGSVYVGFSIGLLGLAMLILAALVAVWKKRS